MSLAVRSKYIVAAIAILTTFAIASPTAADAEKKPGPSIKLMNKTDRPIYVYLNGRFITRCEANRTQTVDCTIEGDVTGVGRFRCDTWGPEKLSLHAGETTRWEFHDESAGSPAGPANIAR